VCQHVSAEVQTDNSYHSITLSQDVQLALDWQKWSRITDINRQCRPWVSRTWSKFASVEYEFWLSKFVECEQRHLFYKWEVGM